MFGEIREDRLFPPDHLTTTGTEGTFGNEIASRAVVGGAGRFFGATGSAQQEILGPNTTVFNDGSGDPAPNVRFDFDLILPDD